MADRNSGQTHEQPAGPTELERYWHHILVEKDTTYVIGPIQGTISDGWAPLAAIQRHRGVWEDDGRQTVPSQPIFDACTTQPSLKMPVSGQSSMGERPFGHFWDPHKASPPSPFAGNSFTAWEKKPLARPPPKEDDKDLSVPESQYLLDSVKERRERHKLKAASSDLQSPSDEDTDAARVAKREAKYQGDKGEVMRQTFEAMDLCSDSGLSRSSEPGDIYVSQARRSESDHEERKNEGIEAALADDRREHEPHVAGDRADDSASNSETEVEKIVSRRTLKDGTVKYRVRWMGFSGRYDTWLTAEELKNAPEALADFEYPQT